MVARGSYKVGAAGVAEVVLSALGGYKPNQDYPYKFKLQPADGLSFPETVVQKDRMTIEGKRATMAVRFTPNSIGPKVLAGEFAFSVCTDQKCLIEKRELSLSFEVE